MTRLIQWTMACIVGGSFLAGAARAEEPPAIDPFGPRAEPREDAVPGYLELSDGTIRPGQIFLTRDHGLKVFDEQQQRQREISLRVIRGIDCVILREWLEKEWRFKANASDEKYYTGRSYPVREYVHIVSLVNGPSIRGPLSAIIYVQAEGADMPERFLLHKRDKGDPGQDLSALVHVRSIHLGEKALQEGKHKAAQPRTPPATRGR
jgi:hypothetical protein